MICVIRIQLNVRTQIYYIEKANMKSKSQNVQLHKNRTEAALEHGKAVLAGRDKGNKFGVECPCCHATNVKKITNTSKAVHTALFGIFSMGRNSKQSPKVDLLSPRLVV